MSIDGFFIKLTSRLEARNSTIDAWIARVLRRIRISLSLGVLRSQRKDKLKAINLYVNSKFPNINLNEYFYDIYLRYDNILHDEVKSTLYPECFISEEKIIDKYHNVLADGEIKKNTADNFDVRCLSRMRGDFIKFGYVVAPFELSDDAVQNFMQASRKIEYTLSGLVQPGLDTAYLPDTPAAAKAVQYLHKVNQGSESLYPQAVRSLIFDISCYLMQQKSLALCSDQFWYSYPVKAAPGQHDAAQGWHFDLDALSWIKVFTFFTPVDERSGAHEAVLGSHLSGAKPAAVRAYGTQRLPVDLIERTYASSKVFELPAGSIVFGDTKCLHRGRPLKASGYRCMYQFYLTVPPGSFHWPTIKVHNFK